MLINPRKIQKYFLGLVFKHLICIFKQSYLAFRLNLLAFGDISISVLLHLLLSICFPRLTNVSRLANCFFFFFSLPNEKFLAHKYEANTSIKLSYPILLCIFYSIDCRLIHRTLCGECVYARVHKSAKRILCNNLIISLFKRDPGSSQRAPCKLTVCAYLWAWLTSCWVSTLSA